MIFAIFLNNNKLKSNGTGSINNTGKGIRQS